MHTAYALQQDFEPNELRMRSKNENSSDYGTFIDQPVLTRWENSSKSYKKSLARRTGFVKLCKAILNLHNATHNTNKIASHHASLAKEEPLTTMCYFYPHVVTAIGITIMNY